MEHREFSILDGNVNKYFVEAKTTISFLWRQRQQAFCGDKGNNELFVET
jgi:hypothetical protein